MQAYLKIIRLPSLLILAIAMYGVRYCLIGAWLTEATVWYPFDEINRPITFSMGNLYFGLLVISTVLITAAGFIINDYFDLKTDRVNRPGSNAVGKGVSRRMAILLHVVLNSIAMLIGFYLAWKSGAWRLLGVQVFSITALWLYSSYLKKRAGFGDLVASFLTALIPVSVYLYEFYFGFRDLSFELNSVLPFYEIPATARLDLVPKVILGFALLAFITTFIGQVYKDLDHLEGDRVARNRTLPLAWGVTKAKNLALLLSIITFVLIVLTQYIMLEWQLKFTLWYAMAFVQLPLVISIIVALRAKEKKQYAILNRLLFAVLIAGVLVMPMLYIDITGQFGIAH